MRLATIHLRAATGSSFCEWKGSASYLDIVAGDHVAARSAWTYPTPTAPFALLDGHVALYAAAKGGFFVDGERVRPQPGTFYGGWKRGVDATSRSAVSGWGRKPRKGRPHGDSEGRFAPMPLGRRCDRS